MNNFKWGAIIAIFAFVVSVLLGFLFRVGISHIFIRAIIFSVVFFGIGFGLRLLIGSFFPEILVPDDNSGDDAYGSSENGDAGSRVNIVMDNTGEYAVPELFKAPDNPHEMGNINDLILTGNRSRNGNGYHSKGIDADREGGYNNTGGSSDSFGAPEEIPYMDSGYQDDSAYDGGAAAGSQPAFTPSFGDDGGLGGLPDLDMMARAFSGFGADAPAAPRGGGGASPPPAEASGASSMPTMSFSEIEDMEPPSPGGGGERTPARNTGNKPEPIKGDFSPKELAEGIRAVLSKDK